MLIYYIAQTLISTQIYEEPIFYSASELLIPVRKRVPKHIIDRKEFREFFLSQMPVNYHGFIQYITRIDITNGMLSVGLSRDGLNFEFGYVLKSMKPQLLWAIKTNNWDITYTYHKAYYDKWNSSEKVVVKREFYHKERSSGNFDYKLKNKKLNSLMHDIKIYIDINRGESNQQICSGLIASDAKYEIDTFGYSCKLKESCLKYKMHVTLVNKIDMNKIKINRINSKACCSNNYLDYEESNKYDQ